MPSLATRPLFDEAKRLGVGFCLGYAELTAGRAPLQQPGPRRSDGAIVATYRKVHLPGHAEDEPDRPFQHAERYYFEPGPDEFGVWDASVGASG